MTAKFPSFVGMGQGFPKMLKITHKYAENVTLTSTTGITQAYRYKANGMYDPNATGGGHQPMFFDQIGAIYQHFTVVGSKITVKFIPTASSSVPQHVGININDDSTGVQGIAVDTLAEQATTNCTNIAYTPEKPVILTQTWSAKKHFGGSVLGNANLIGTINNDPGELSFFTIYNCACDGATTVACYLIVEIEYTAIWRELKDFNSS